ncbi:MAG: hypothetical protein R2705_17280 [Ilumatobacteraceae bacterium]
MQLGDGDRTPSSPFGQFDRFSCSSAFPARFAARPARRDRAGARTSIRHRCSGDQACAFDLVSALLPRFASVPHKDRRAPQNLAPIAGLERQLRRRLGDPALLFTRIA